MAKLFCLIALLFSLQYAHGQCKSGDCTNGKGVYDFGWCVYNGEFKDGKPSGKGTMKYDDYTYTGSFSNGVEDGQGVITYKTGKTEDVLYSNGVKQKTGPAKVAPGDYKEIKGTNAGCINGDCETGFGTFKFPGGNVYTGSFVDEIRQGKGTMAFANGDVLEGNFRNNAIVTGTYKFNNGCRFTGTWDSKGNMYDGMYYNPVGTAVRLANGQVIPPEPVYQLPANLPRGAIIVYGDLPGEKPCKNFEVCPDCGGRKVLSRPIVTKYSYTVPGSYSIDSHGNRHTDYESVSSEHTRSIPNYEVCGKCKGKGKICTDKD
jgi:hypothetical protein